VAFFNAKKIKLIKMKLSNRNESMIQALTKGYKVDLNGDVWLNDKNVRKYTDKKGYFLFSVKVKLNGKSTVYKLAIHRMQAYQKYGDVVFDTRLCVRHKDGNCKNNRYDNILIGSYSDNMMDVPQDVRLKKSIKASSFIKKYNHEEIIKMHNEGLSYGKIMEKIGIKSKGTISFIVNQSIASKS